METYYYAAIATALGIKWVALSIAAVRDLRQRH